jgi:hypothetical protein
LCDARLLVRNLTDLAEFHLRLVDHLAQLSTNPTPSALDIAQMVTLIACNLLQSQNLPSISLSRGFPTSQPTGGLKPSVSFTPSDVEHYWEETYTTFCAPHLDVSKVWRDLPNYIREASKCHLIKKTIQLSQISVSSWIVQNEQKECERHGCDRACLYKQTSKKRNFDSAGISHEKIGNNPMVRRKRASRNGWLPHETLTAPLVEMKEGFHAAELDETEIETLAPPISHSSSRWTFEDFIAQPLQRLTRYPLIFQEILRSMKKLLRAQLRVSCDHLSSIHSVLEAIQHVEESVKFLRRMVGLVDANRGLYQQVSQGNEFWNHVNYLDSDDTTVNHRMSYPSTSFNGAKLTHSHSLSYFSSKNRKSFLLDSSSSSSSWNSQYDICGDITLVKSHSGSAWDLENVIVNPTFEFLSHDNLKQRTTFVEFCRWMQGQSDWSLNLYKSFPSQLPATEFLCLRFASGLRVSIHDQSYSVEPNKVSSPSGDPERSNGFEAAGFLFSNGTFLVAEPYGNESKSYRVRFIWLLNSKRWTLHELHYKHEDRFGFSLVSPQCDSDLKLEIFCRNEIQLKRWTQMLRDFVYCNTHTLDEDKELSDVLEAPSSDQLHSQCKDEQNSQPISFSLPTPDVSPLVFPSFGGVPMPLEWEELGSPVISSDEGLSGIKSSSDGVVDSGYASSTGASRSVSVKSHDSNLGEKSGFRVSRVWNAAKGIPRRATIRVINCVSHHTGWKSRESFSANSIDEMFARYYVPEKEIIHWSANSEHWKLGISRNTYRTRETEARFKQQLRCLANEEVMSPPISPVASPLELPSDLFTSDVSSDIVHALKFADTLPDSPSPYYFDTPCGMSSLVPMKVMDDELMCYITQKPLPAIPGTVSSTTKTYKTQGKWNRLMKRLHFPNRPRVIV